MSNDAKQQAIHISDQAMIRNFKTIHRARASLAIFSGIISGILGLESSLGFLFYALISCIISLMIIVKVGSEMKYFLDWMTPATCGITGNLPSYVLFWTLTYNLIYVFDVY